MCAAQDDGVGRGNAESRFALARLLDDDDGGGALERRDVQQRCADRLSPRQRPCSRDGDTSCRRCAPGGRTPRPRGRGIPTPGVLSPAAGRRNIESGPRAPPARRRQLWERRIPNRHRAARAQAYVFSRSREVEISGRRRAPSSTAMPAAGTRYIASASHGRRGLRADVSRCLDVGREKSSREAECWDRDAERRRGIAREQRAAARSSRDPQTLRASSPRPRNAKMVARRRVARAPRRLRASAAGRRSVVSARPARLHERWSAGVQRERSGAARTSTSDAQHEGDRGSAKSEVGNSASGSGGRRPRGNPGVPRGLQSARTAREHRARHAARRGPAENAQNAAGAPGHEDERSRSGGAPRDLTACAGRARRVGASFYQELSPDCAK